MWFKLKHHPYWLLSFSILSFALSQYGHSSPIQNIGILTKEAAIKNVMCLDDMEDFLSHGWRNHTTDYSYTDLPEGLPPLLKNEMDGYGIFWFQGGQNSNQWFITSQFKPVKTKSDICMYIKYYAHASIQRVRVLAFPANGESGDGDYFMRLDTTHNFTWGEQLVGINPKKLKGRGSTIGVKTLGLRDGEYFLLDKIIIMESPCQSFKNFSKICPMPIAPKSTNNNQHNSRSNSRDFTIFPKDRTDCVDTMSQMEETDWRIFPPKSFKYAAQENQLPAELRGKIQANGIFYSEVNLTMTPHLQFTDFSGKLPMFIYLKYYIHTPNKLFQKVIVTPTALSFTHPAELPATNDFQWMEFYTEIDGVKGADIGIEVGVLQFSVGDFFLIDKIILTQGYPISDLTQFQQLCPFSTPTPTSPDSTTQEFTTEELESTFLTTEGVVDSTSSDNTVYLVTLTLVLFFLTSFVVIFFWRRMTETRRSRERRRLSTAEVSEFTQGDSRLSLVPDKLDPPIYLLPYDHSLEISRSRIQLDKKLGAGQFGVVHQGYLLSHTNKPKELVAIKTVKEGVDVETFKALLSEIKILSNLEPHPNICGLVGACTTSIKKLEVMAVVEFCANGDLLNCLRKKGFVKFPSTQGGYMKLDQPNTFLTPELLHFCIGIANGMKYLTEKNVVHGDLAARNILLTDKMEVKISDFGLSRQLLKHSVYHKKQLVLPWMWMPIESLKYMKFSVKSDVWSFGVVLWEIWSLGEDPYPGLYCGQTFLKDLVDGKRLEKPQLANGAIYQIMLKCWQKEPEGRPSFKELYSQLCNLLTPEEEEGSCQRMIPVDVVITSDFVPVDDGDQLLRRRESVSTTSTY